VGEEADREGASGVPRIGKAAGAPDELPIAAARRALHWGWRLGAVGLALAWTLLFAVGVLVDSAPYRKALNEVAGTAAFARNLGLVILAYSPTNMLALCCVCSLLGTLSRRTHAIHASEERDRDAFVAALSRGFFIFVLGCSGLLLLKGEVIFGAPTQVDYIRHATLLSMFAFIAGFYPEVFWTLADKVSEVARKGSKPNL
jgi:hypothetical protein